ncbi:RING-H2 finger protein ATL47 [Senna tora]|uniref:RING-type E3 ubiquitin transferase n=1 Tax=Senna tora TaxID=362788 RepID=A0A835CED7_9FABA|nr:RING-H2 finger protein ATL47 [Senna tora]
MPSIISLQKGDSFKYYHYYTSSPESPFSSFQSPYDEKSSSSSSISRISPLILLVIIVLALIFFLYGIVHLVLWFLMKTPSSPSSSSSPLYQSSNRFPPESTRSRGLQRQLHHLFRLHDSGLEQSLIDALPVFYYEDVVVLGSKQPFDCAVCLCEFSEQDKLRLLPMCSHAFHINCIDTWLLSNSTCPLCRATISISSSSSSGLSMENPLYRFRGGGGGERDEENNVGCSDGEDQNGEKRVFSVRLGKFRNVNGGGGMEEDDGEEEGNNTNTTSSSRDMNGRRCYSMGSYQYVVSGSDVKVIWLWSNKTNFHYSSNNTAFP